MMAHRDVVRTLQLLVYYYMDVVYRCACAGDVVDVVRAVVSGLSACACWREPLRYEECSSTIGMRCWSSSGGIAVQTEQDADSSRRF